MIPKHLTGAVRPSRPGSSWFEPGRRERGVRLEDLCAVQDGDEALVVSARAGDRHAFARLWEDHAPRVHGVLLGMVPSDEADDIVQDVAVAALRSIGGLKRAESFSAWLRTIARNFARKHHRWRARTGCLQLGDADDVLDGDSCSHDRADAEAEAEEVLACIRSLPSCYREPLLLRLVLGMSGPEIARETGLTPGSVRVNLHRGMQRLRRMLRHLE